MTVRDCVVADEPLERLPAPDVRRTATRECCSWRPARTSALTRWLCWRAARSDSGPLDYGYSTVPRPPAGGRVFSTPRARVLGGTTAINAMIYSRPGPDDLGAWGLGWSYGECAAALLAMESHRGDRNGTRGTVDPAVNGWASEPNQLTTDFMQAAIEAGYPATADILRGRAKVWWLGRGGRRW